MTLKFVECANSVIEKRIMKIKPIQSVRIMWRDKRKKNVDNLKTFYLVSTTSENVKSKDVFTIILDIKRFGVG